MTWIVGKHPFILALHQGCCCFQPIWHLCSPASSILLPSGSRFSRTDRRFHKLWELWREKHHSYFKPSLTKSLSNVKVSALRHLTCAHMRMMSVLALSQSIKTFTTCISPWLVRTSSFSRRVFSLCADGALCWLPSESGSKSSRKNTNTVQSMSLKK